MSIYTPNRDWHYLRGDHDENCIFSQSLMHPMVPCNENHRIMLVKDWNRRPAPQPDGWCLRNKLGHVIAWYANRDAALSERDKYWPASTLHALYDVPVAQKAPLKTPRHVSSGEARDAARYRMAVKAGLIEPHTEVRLDRAIGAAMDRSAPGREG